VGLIALVTIILLLYAASRSWLRTLIVLLTVRFSVAGQYGPYDYWAATGQGR
jgi:predicted RND superfamily exporter protein